MKRDIKSNISILKDAQLQWPQVADSQFTKVKVGRTFSKI